jgi:hypothetical protein
MREVCRICSWLARYGLAVILFEDMRAYFEMTTGSAGFILLLLTVFIYFSGLILIAHWQVLLDTVMNLRVSYKEGYLAYFP